MEKTNSCRCCLRRPPDRDMKIPYISFGKTEIYSDMLKECFEIHLTNLLSDDKCGICEVCVGRLRDASDFKLQVQRSQEELRSFIDWEKLVKEEEGLVKMEISINDEELICQINGYSRRKSRVLLDMFRSITWTGHRRCPSRRLLRHFSEEVKLETFDPLPSGGAETEREETELLLDTENEVSDVCKQESTLKYELEDTSCLTSKKKNSGSGILIKKEPNTCKTCGKRFATKIQLKKHRQKHKEIDNTCKLCNKRFKYKSRLNIHNCIQTKPFVCTVCNRQFAQKQFLNKHKLVHLGEKPFGCDQCDKKFSDIMYLNTHKRLHTGGTLYTCDICKTKFMSKNCLISHIGRHQGKKYFSCKFCSKMFWSHHNLYQHKRTHIPDIVYKCEVCGKGFIRQYYLTQHLKSHRAEEYPCDYCTKKLASISSLQRHKLIHTGEKPHSCEVCRVSFRHKHNLDKHQLIHTGDKSHCCDACGKRFARKDYLNRHLQTHVVGKQYSCELCTKSYSTKEGLRQHRRIHTKKKTVAKLVSKKLKKKK